ncbi:MAG: FUSC family membrane protein, partial [Pollutimonas bauzanensis]
MASRIPQLQRFFYSHYFFGGMRQAVGVLLPALLLAGVFQLYSVGMIAAIGAACVAIIDQPGGPRRYGTNGMLGAILLGSLTAAITGLASSHGVLIWLVVPALCFIFSMFTVFGKQGGLLGFACLLLMTLTMRTPLDPHQVLMHTVYSFLGGVFYFVFSFAVHRLLWHREEQQALSVALFATADYIIARSQFYDVNADLEASYRKLIHAQSAMTEK